MMKRFLRGALRLLVTGFLALAAGALGWCWIGWINGTTNTPQAIFQKPAEQQATDANKVKAYQRLLNQPMRGNAEARVRELYHQGQSLSASERKQVQQDLWKSPSHHLRSLLVQGDDAPDYYAGSVYVANVLRTWMAGDHTACLAAIEQLPPYLRSQIPTRLLKAGTMINGQAALKMLGPSLLKMIPPEGLDTTMRAWAEQDAAGAMAFAQQMTTPEAQQKAMAGVLRSMATSDPNRCLQLLATMPPESAKPLSADLALRLPYQTVLDNYDAICKVGGQNGVFPALEHLAETNPAAATQWLQAHPAAWNGRAFDARTADPYGSREPLMNVMSQALVAGTGEIDLMTQKLQEMSNAWSYSFTQFPQMEKWLQTQTNPAVRAPVLRGMMDSAARLGEPATAISYWQEVQQLDPVAAAKADVHWTQYLPDKMEAPLSQEALNSFTPEQQAQIFQQRPQLFTPTDAMSRSLQIQDFSDRLSQAMRVVETFGTSNPQELQAWIQQLPTDEERTYVTKHLAEITKQ